MAQFKVYRNLRQADVFPRMMQLETRQSEPTDLSAACGIVVGVALGAAAWGFVALLYFTL